MISIFTPVYNRAFTLKRLYKSLKSQTCKEFEWIIVNDGSSDNSEEIIKLFLKKKNDFPIRYYVKENGGKHRAINFAVPLAAGELFFIVDSDDWLAENAVEKILDVYKDIENDSNFAGVAGLKITENNIVSGTTFVGKYIDATSLERRSLNIIGEKSEVFRTDILKQYPFPEYKGERFISEGVVWNKIASAGYKIRWFNTPIYYYEYQNSGLTANLRNLYKNNPQGYMLYIKQEIKFLNVSCLQALIWRGRVIDTLKHTCTVKKICYGLEITRTQYICSRFLFAMNNFKNKILCPKKSL